MFYGYAQRVSSIKKLFILQFFLGGMAITAFSIIKHDLTATFSGILGVLLVMLPSLIYVRMTVLNKRVANPYIILGRHKKAMVVRFFSSALLFLFVVLLYRKCNFLVLFVTYCVAISSNWFVLLGTVDS